MYGGYTCSSALSIRAKRSLRSSYFSDDTTGTTTSLIPVHGVSVNPRVLYGYYYLRQSSLIHWSPPPPPPSRLLVHCRSTGVYGCYCRAARWCCCCSGGGGGTGGGYDARFGEMVGLLAENEGVSAGANVGEFSRLGRLSRKANLLSVKRRKETRVNCHSDSSEVEIPDGLLGENEYRGRTERRDGGISRNRTRRSEEGSKFSERRSSTVATSDSQSRCGWKGEELVKSKVLGKEKKETSALWNSTVNEKKEEERIQGEIRRIREERQKLSKMSEVRNEISEAKEEKNEEISSLALELLEEVKRQRIELDQLNKNYKELLVKRAEEDHTTRTSMLNVASTSRAEERENVISSSIVTLVEELRKQRVEIDRLIRSHQVVNDSTEIHEIDTERVFSSNKVSVSRFKDLEESTTSTLNLVDVERMENNQKTDHQKITGSSRKNESRVQQDSSTNKVHISKFKNINEASTSDMNIENNLTQEHRYSDQYRNNDYEEVLKTSEFHDIDTHRTSSSNEMVIASSTLKDISSTLSGTSVEDVRLQETSLNHSGKDNAMLTRSSVPHEVVAHKASNTTKLFTSAKDGEDSSISASNLFENRRQQEISSRQSSKGNKIFTKSATIHEMDTQSAITLNKIVTTSSGQREESSSSTNKEMIQHGVSKDNRMLRISPEMHGIDAQRLTSQDKMEFSSSEAREGISFSGILVDEHMQQSSSGQSRKNDKILGVARMHEVVSEEASNSRMEASSKFRHGVERLNSAVNLSEVSIEQQQGFSGKFQKDGYEFTQPGSISNLYLTSDLRPIGNDSISETSMNLTKGKEQQYYAYEQNVGGYPLSSPSPKSNEIAEVEEKIANSPTLSTKDMVDDEGNSSLMVTPEEERENSSASPGSQWKMATESFARTLDARSSSVACSDHQEPEEESRRDLLESASRLDHSSSLYVDEFVDKLHEEMLVSDDSDATSKYSSGIDMDITSIHNGQTDSALKQSPDDDPTTGFLGQTSVDSAGKHKSQTLLQEAHPDSASSEERGPSAELWNVTVPSSKQCAQEDQSEKEGSQADVQLDTVSATSGNAIKRSGQSFWRFIAEVIQLGWITRAGSGKSTPQSRTRRSANESASTDTWFSGHEQEEDNEHAGKRKHVISDMAVLHQEGETSKEKLVKPQMKGSKLMSSKISGSDVPINLLMSSESETFTVDGSSKVGISSSLVAPLVPSVTVGSSQLPSSTSVQGTVEFHRSDMQMGGSLESEEEPVGNKFSRVAEKEQKDGDLRRRKFQRNKQVLREQFDEWEEAHKLEIEQRKADEFFMREALLEAKKAAEAWEVPIGAVLVQNGSIIARGSNLVEELRDSTAHAEMICIREASNFLRTWRLSDTTLYVTLEPCAMCAGAILQARIDTVVWGAPNKLLGADGSWVRLFPGGNEGQDVLDQSSRMAGPVHPFHPKIKIRRGILATECSEAMQQFFQLRRKKGKEEEEPQPSCLPISTYPTKLATKLHHMFTMMFCL